MKTKTIIALLLLSITLLGSRCGNKDPEPEDYVRLSQDFLDYCAFPVGSWWVYEDSTGAEDSIWVIEYDVQEQDAGTHVQEELRYVESLSYHTKNTQNEYYYLGGANSYSEAGHYIFLLSERMNIGNSSFSFNRFRYPTGDWTQNFYHYQHHDAFEVLDVNFNDVEEFGYSQQDYENPIQKEYYAKGIGVIQREMFDGTIWKLKKYHIQ